VSLRLLRLDQLQSGGCGLGGGADPLGSVVCRTAGPAGNFRAGVEGLVREVGMKDYGIATTMLQG
jgi:hypothetical protein